MRPLYIFFFVAALAGCQTQSAVPFEPVTDRCNSLQYLSKVGMKVDDATADAFPPGTRIIKPGTMVTRDHRPDRLNVHVNDNGRIERIDCG